ncbi:MAG: A/G-specific adenine glycosylase [bacterium]
MRRNVMLPCPECDDKVRRAFHVSLLKWYHREKRPLPWRLNPTPYAVAVAEFMCQQTQISAVLPYYERWMKRFPNWQALARAKESEVLKLWEGLGYYRRARSLHALAQAVTRNGGELPSEAEALEKMPGIGPYTAGAIASVAFGKRAALVDGNVERVFCRVFNLRQEVGVLRRGTLKVLAEKLLPKKNCGDYNQALMECGARICAPRKPQCLICSLRSVCLAVEPESLPVKKKEIGIVEKEELAWICRDGKIWLALPRSPKRWSGFYRLPFFDARTMKRGEVCCRHAYSITKYRVQATVVSAEPKKSLKEGRWFSFAELEGIFLPAPMRKMVRLILSRTP